MAKTKQQTIEDGRQAQRLLSDEALMRVFAEVEGNIYDSFAACDPMDPDEMMRLRSELFGVQTLRTRLRIWADNAKIEDSKQT